MSLSQSPKPGAHDVNTQLPFTQLKPPPVLQTVPQAPQFVLLLSCVSQPLAALVSQLP
jgi:hypothetical protein